MEDEKKVRRNMFAEEGKRICIAVGGAAIYGQDPHAEEICREMIEAAEEIDLSTDKEFQDHYMDAMYFEQA